MPKLLTAANEQGLVLQPAKALDHWLILWHAAVGHPEDTASVSGHLAQCLGRAKWACRLTLKNFSSGHQVNFSRGLSCRMQILSTTRASQGPSQFLST